MRCSGGIALWLQSTRPVAAVVELGSLAHLRNPVKRIRVLVAIGMLLAACIAVASFAIQCLGIYHEVVLAEQQGHYLLVCQLPYETAVFHGVIAFAVWSMIHRPVRELIFKTILTQR